MNFVIKVLVACILAPWALLHILFFLLLMLGLSGVPGATETADEILRFFFR